MSRNWSLSNPVSTQMNKCKYKIHQCTDKCKYTNNIVVSSTTLHKRLSLGHKILYVPSTTLHKSLSIGYNQYCSIPELPLLATMGLIQETKFTKKEFNRIQIQLQEKTNENPCLFRQVKIKIIKVCHKNTKK